MAKGNEELVRFAETVGAEMYQLLAANLKRNAAAFEGARPEDAMVALVNTGLIPLVLLSRLEMFRGLDPDAFAQRIAAQFVKLNAVVTKVPKPTSKRPYEYGRQLVYWPRLPLQFVNPTLAGSALFTSR